MIVYGVYKVVRHISRDWLSASISNAYFLAIQGSGTNFEKSDASRTEIGNSSFTEVGRVARKSLRISSKREITSGGDRKRAILAKAFAPDSCGGRHLSRTRCSNHLWTHSIWWKPKSTDIFKTFFASDLLRESFSLLNRGSSVSTTFFVSFPFLGLSGFPQSDILLYSIY